MFRYVITVFLSAFLLFQVQPYICKFILPWFGGTPAVWTACMLFFQLFLVGGYAYAHWTTQRLSPRAQGLLHLCLLLAAVCCLPVIPDPGWKPAGGQEPVWRILCLLAATVGGPYLLLSATGPLLQAWFGRQHPGRSPYRLYALSNAGSLLALLSYPFVIEPALPLKIQGQVWSLAFGLFALCCGYCALRLFREKPQTDTLPASDPSLASGSSPATTDHWPLATDHSPLTVEPASLAPPPFALSPDSAPTWTDRLQWLALAACGSTVLLSGTNQMALDVAAVPFLWVLPLSLYLLSFIICFDHDRWYYRPVWSLALLLGWGAAIWAIGAGVHMIMPLQVGCHALAIFTCCMACHGELTRSRPGPRHLTAFYLLISVGGALGGVFVTVLAPLLSNRFWEYQISLALTGALLLAALFRDQRSPLWGGRPRWVWAVLLLGLAALTVSLYEQMRRATAPEGGSVLAWRRNFYGVFRVDLYGSPQDEEGFLVLCHGRINHGIQYCLEPRRHQATSYFGPESGIGIAADTLHRLTPSGLRLGVLGLGTGSLSVYGKAGDYMCFYEINADLVRLSDKYFSYRTDSPARPRILLGDGRTTMERQREAGQPQRFDLLALDAFNSDSPPLHLLTREAFQTYWYHLKPNGALAVNVCNRFLDLCPLVRGLAHDCGKEAILIEQNDNSADGTTYACSWMLVTSNQEFLNAPEVQGHITQTAGPSPLLFTDDYSDLFEILRWRLR